MKDWPEEMVFGKLTHYSTPDGKPGYSIEGLPGFPEKIENHYIDHPLETIMKYLHLIIYDLLGYSARDYLRIKMHDLRPETIQKEFEDSLKSGLADPENLNWSPRSIKIAKEYFSVNYPSSSKNNQ